MMILPDTASMLASVPRPAQDPTRIELSSDGAAHASFQLVFSELSGAMAGDVPLDDVSPDDIAPMLADAPMPAETDESEVAIELETDLSLAADPAPDALPTVDPAHPRDPATLPHDRQAQLWHRDAQGPLLAAQPNSSPVRPVQPAPTLMASADGSDQPVPPALDPAVPSAPKPVAAPAPIPVPASASNPVARSTPDREALSAPGLAAPLAPGRAAPLAPNPAAPQVTDAVALSAPDPAASRVSNPADPSAPLPANLSSPNAAAPSQPDAARPLVPGPAASVVPDPAAPPAPNTAPDSLAKGEPRLPDRASIQAPLSPLSAPLRSEPPAPFAAEPARVVAPALQSPGPDLAAAAPATQQSFASLPRLDMAETRIATRPTPYAPRAEPAVASPPSNPIINPAVARGPIEQPSGSAPSAPLAPPVSPVLAPPPDMAAIAPRERALPNDPIQSAQAPVTPQIAVPTPQPPAHQPVQPLMAQAVQPLPQPTVEGASDSQVFVSDTAQYAEIRPVSDLPNVARGLHDILQRPELPRQVLTQLVAAIQRAPGEKNLDLTLNPAELGRVRISLTPGDAGIVVTILAERPETLDLMRRHVETLAQDFIGMGYGRAEFNFGQAPQHSGQRDNRGAGTFDRQGTDPEPFAQGVAPVRISHDRVDIRL